MSGFKQYTTGEMLDRMPHLTNGSSFICVAGPKAMDGVGIGTVVVKANGEVAIKNGNYGPHTPIILTMDLCRCKWEMEPYEINEEDFLDCFARGDVIEIRAEGQETTRISSRQSLIKLTPEQLIKGKFYIAREVAKK